MGNAIKPEALGAAVAKELTLYHRDLLGQIDRLTTEKARELVRLTKASAPRGASGDFRRAISSRLLERTRMTVKHVWYVKAPHYRLTHLLVHGHATPDGGRTRANPFLQNALDTVLPDYERGMEDLLNGK